MQQLLLDVSMQTTPSLDNFLPGRNEELLDQLRKIASRDSGEHFLYLWGENAVGKTHLLKALAHNPASRYIDGAGGTDRFDYDGAISLYLLDNADALNDVQQVQAFNLFNQVRENRAYLVTSGNSSPVQLDLRADLKSRLSWGLSYRLQQLSDTEKINALAVFANERGFKLASDVLPYLITHYPRDMRSLMAVLDALDAYSLETKRLITLPLLREMLQKRSDKQ